MSSSFFARQQQVAALDPRLGGLLASAGLYNLKSLIKAIRSTKTLADERSLIQKESAAIRTSFKDDDPFSRHNNIAKLLYIHMLGYPAHFGQIECLKLVATPRFTDKRLGYLGVMLLLDENTEVLTLVTNGLKNDMEHSNMYVVGLALCTFANIASEEMSRDLCNSIEKLMGSSNTYVRRKAAICATRIIRKTPDLIDHFISKARALLGDKNHGVLLCGVTLVTEICMREEEARGEFRKAVPLLVRHLKALVTTGYSPEHDVSGITDPFLQCRILRLLRILGTNDVPSSEAMNDVLAQVATNTEASKNVGNSILYETVLTILDIEAENGLRVMAINILGKFLSNRDNNIRYVALNTLNKVVGMDVNAVQRHRTIILDCLKDGDISIRRRALELSYELINESNVRVLTRELLAFLEVSDNEFKDNLTKRICGAADRFAPNKRWHLDTVIRVLKLAGNYVSEEVLSSFIRLICHTPELQAYTVQKLFSALNEDFSQESLTLSAVWVIGEFGEILLEGGSFEDEELVREVKPSDIVDLLSSVLDSPYTTSQIRQYVLTSLAKLSVRINSSQEQQRLEVLLARFDSSVETELQGRSVEFGALLKRRDIRDGVLESMPAPEIKATVMGTRSESKPVGRTGGGDLLDLMGEEETSTGNVPTNQNGRETKQSTQDLLADIFGGDGGMGGDLTSNGTSTTTTSTQVSHKSTNDIMDLFGGGISSSNNSGGMGMSSGTSHLSSMSSPTSSQPQNNMDSLNSGLSGLDIFGGSSSSSSTPTPAAPPAQPQPQISTPQAYKAYDQKGLKITLSPVISPARPDVVNITARFECSGSDGISGVNFQAAVPKTQKLQMLAISNGDISPGSVETQQMRVMASKGSQIRLRLRVAFSKNGESIQDQVDFSGFPAGLMA